MKILAIGPMYNEGEKTLRTIRRFPPGIVDEIVIVDDASTDGAGQKVAEAGVTVLSHAKNSGPGTAIRTGIDYGLKKGYDIFVIFATNGKDDPQETPRVLRPVLEGGADMVQGSRYLPGGGWSHMPNYRVGGIQAYSFIFSLLAGGRRVTDATNGFKAFRSSILKDPRINLWQDWLDGYPLEAYLFFQTLRLGYRVVEVPVTKTYPNSGTNYTKMRAWIDWWHAFKPMFYLTLRLKK